MSAGVPASVELLTTARRGLLEATLAETPAERYATAHLAALRAAAAVLAARAQPSGRRSGPRSVWVLLPRVAPEFGEWAQATGKVRARRSTAEIQVDQGHRGQFLRRQFARQAHCAIRIGGSVGLVAQ
jgi:hypothetical protein